MRVPNIGGESVAAGLMSKHAGEILWERHRAARQFCPANVLAKRRGRSLDAPDDGLNRHSGLEEQARDASLYDCFGVRFLADSVTTGTVRIHLTNSAYNNILVTMLPELILNPGSPWPVLPEGLHLARLDDVLAIFATNPWRRLLFDGLVDGLRILALAGCARVFLDGSFVTGKPNPRDFDACWDPAGIDPGRLDPVFRDFSHQRAAQKARFKGEFFPSSLLCADVGKSFLEFFQTDQHSGKKKGIVVIELNAEPMLQPQVTP